MRIRYAVLALILVLAGLGAPPVWAASPQPWVASGPSSVASLTPKATAAMPKSPADAADTERIKKDLREELEEPPEEPLAPPGCTLGRSPCKPAAASDLAAAEYDGDDLGDRSPTLGGVDFSTMELRYVSDTYDGALAAGLRYAYQVEPKPGTPVSYGGKESAQLAAEAFFTWLVLPPARYIKTKGTGSEGCPGHSTSSTTKSSTRTATSATPAASAWRPRAEPPGSCILCELRHYGVMAPVAHPAIGIVTALPIECFAVQAVLDGVATARAVEPGDGASYWTGSVPSSEPDTPHRVVLSLLTEDGGVAAAHGCANLQRTWQVDQLVMCGIACGVPRPDDPPRHVRLGDILVAEDGIVPYGHVRAMSGGREELRRPAAKPSVPLRDAARRLRVTAESGHRPWEFVLQTRGRAAAEDYSRPPASADVLVDDDGSTVPHPPTALTGHVRGRPRVHYGRLGSGGKLINSAAERNRLARAFRLIGFDMEGDGIADAAYLQRLDWFMVRGVSDYGSGKTDRWHRYAALAAAAYVRALLGELEPRPVRAAEARRPAGPQPLGAGADHQEVVEALWAVRTMRDRDGRDQVVAALTEVSGMRIGRARDAYRDVDGIVRTVGRLPGGLGDLVSVLSSIEHDSVPLRRLAELVGHPPIGHDRGR